MGREPRQREQVSQPHRQYRGHTTGQPEGPRASRRPSPHTALQPCPSSPPFTSPLRRFNSRHGRRPRRRRSCCGGGGDGSSNTRAGTQLHGRAGWYLSAHARLGRPEPVRAPTLHRVFFQQQRSFDTPRWAHGGTGRSPCTCRRTSRCRCRRW